MKIPGHKRKRGKHVGTPTCTSARHEEEHIIGRREVKELKVPLV